MYFFCFIFQQNALAIIIYHKIQSIRLKIQGQSINCIVNYFYFCILRDDAFLYILIAASFKINKINEINYTSVWKWKFSLMFLSSDHHKSYFNIEIDSVQSICIFQIVFHKLVITWFIMLHAYKKNQDPEHSPIGTRVNSIQLIGDIFQDPCFFFTLRSVKLCEKPLILIEKNTSCNSNCSWKMNYVCVW